MPRMSVGEYWRLAKAHTPVNSVATELLQSDVLHVVEGDPQATIIADLASADHIPSNSFDCIILTQTLQLIYDVRAALKTIYRILKPSGILLATFPGISQTYDNEWGDTWYWNFTSLSARRLFEEVFPTEHLKIEAFGNVLAAISFLHGLAVEELRPEELDHREPGYEVTIAVRAQKPVSALTDSEKIARPRARESAHAKAMILMYHRVNEGFTDPWGLCVSSEHFAQQLEMLRRHSQLIRLQELVDAIGAGALSTPSVVVTFDDGYADNLYNAKPILERYDAPATVFVTTGYLGEEREFWWDELDRLLLQPGILPECLQLSVNGRMHEWSLGDAAYYFQDRWCKDRTWRAAEDPPGARQRLYVALWQLFQLLPENDRLNAMTDLCAWVGAANEVRPTHRVLTLEEIVSLERSGLVEIGSHSVTHPLMPQLSANSQREELERSKLTLEKIIGRTIKTFAYPYGSYAAGIIPIVQEVGFNCACTTIESAVTRETDPFQLPRIEVGDWDGDEFSRRVQTWLAD